MQQGDIITGGPWDGFEVISAYSRAQAIQDGTLIPTTDLTPDEPLFANQAGFVCGVALTSDLADLVIPNEAERQYGQDVKGRLWDVLNMARMYKRGVTNEGRWMFPCIFVVKRPEYARSNGVMAYMHKTFNLTCDLSPGDQGEPVTTIGFPRDF